MVECPICQSEDSKIRKRGKLSKEFECNDCGNRWTDFFSRRRTRISKKKMFTNKCL